MRSFLLISLVLATIFLPVVFARVRHPVRGLRWLLASQVIAIVLYVIYVGWIHPYVFVPHWP